jgi:hypothetical protein
MLPGMKLQNGAQIQDGRQNFLSFKTCKFHDFFRFLQDCLNLAHCSSSFLLKIQNGRKIQYGRFFAQKFMIFW